ncbi:coenzyme F420-0:L-glutamate ligase [Candidatus Falkowbacteria bacterium]|nr:coenzyme F420-0:L-glutamate ligase [Candidatus Falkowbacteria bacterium]
MALTKNKKFDIIVGIPTYNEADSISNTVRKIDRGLSKYFPKYSALIVNMDSQSLDGTRRVFLSTKTNKEKMSLAIKKYSPGKGANIFSLLKLIKRLGAKYIATIDADITTITEKWPKLLLDPIIKGEANFVAPIYTRNRYEGNTTNHFCFPLLYAWFGRQLSQPIGGDFAFSSYFSEYILKQQKPKDTFLYGIDIFLSTHALGGNFRIKEVYLGRKIHKPSFAKIIPMFQQVVATMLFILPKYKNEYNISKSNAGIGDKQRIDSFIRKPEPARVAILKKYAVHNLQKLPLKNIQKYLGLNLEEIKEIRKSKFIISENKWVNILANMSKYIAKHAMSDKKATNITTTISPFFFLRVLAYFGELDKIKKQRDIDTFLTAIPDVPLIKEGDDLGAIILKCAGDAGITFEDKDVLVITSKIVSKAEGRLVSLASVQPSARAREIARVSGKDARIVELMMQESQILNAKPGVVETLHRLGFVCTSGGVDRANTARPEEEKVSLLPINPDESARRISDAIAREVGKRIGVVINDSLGIKYRTGSVGLAIGVAAMPAVLKGAAGETDLYGKKRNVNISFADEIAAAGSLLMGQSRAGLPAVLVRGLRYPDEQGNFADLIAADQLRKDLTK